MKSSWHKTAFVLFSALAASAPADIMPPDHHAVERGVAILNAEEYPDKVFIGVETSPGGTRPVGAWRMRAGDYASVGYKFNTIRVYWGLAADWPRIQKDLGVADRWTPGGNPVKGWTLPGGDWSLDGKILARRIEGELETAPRVVPDGDPASAEKLDYRVGALDQGGSLSLFRTTTFYSDNRPPLVKDWPSAIGPSTRPTGALEARLAADGRSLDLRPRFGGSAEVTLVDARGIRVFRTLRDLKAGADHSVALPALANGRYLVTLEGSGDRQAAWIEL